ncbi:MAG: hypothetical protein PVH12_06450 [Candidatus Bathyarchaeota archaeon]|jgi:hypothetical protein
MYFGPRDLTGITIFAALWGVLNVTISPAFFNIFHLPFACDLIGFASLILATWWSRKIGTATFVGLIALVINLIVRPYALHFFGFLAASIVFDLLTFMMGYNHLFEKRHIGSIALLFTSIFSAAFAGLVIGLFFMPSQALIQWGGVIGWAGLHAVGGIIGGTIGVITMNAISIRGFTPKNG